MEERPGGKEARAWTRRKKFESTGTGFLWTGYAYPALYSKLGETERRIAAAYMQGMIAKGELMRQEEWRSMVRVDPDSITAVVRQRAAGASPRPTNRPQGRR